MEIFTRTATNLAGVFSADTLSLAFSDGVPTALVQNLQASYMQNVTRLYEVGNVNGRANVYYVGGRSQGSLNIGRVVGPSVLMSAYYTKFGNVCNARTNNMRFGLGQVDCSGTGIGPAVAASALGAASGLAGALVSGPAVGASIAAAANTRNSASYTCRFCVITQIGISVAAADTIINESSALMFSGMEYTGP